MTGFDQRDLSQPNPGQQSGRLVRLFARCLMCLALLAGALLVPTAPADAYPNPGANGCLGGSLRSAVPVYSGSLYLGQLRIYYNCGAYHAYFTGPQRQSLGVQITNYNSSGIRAWRSMSNQYAVWTDMIPGACVYAQVYYGSRWLPALARTGCG